MSGQSSLLRYSSRPCKAWYHNFSMFHALRADPSLSRLNYRALPYIRWMLSITCKTYGQCSTIHSSASGLRLIRKVMLRSLLVQNYSKYVWARERCEELRSTIKSIALLWFSFSSYIPVQSWPQGLETQLNSCDLALSLVAGSRVAELASPLSFPRKPPVHLSSSRPQH